MTSKVEVVAGLSIARGIPLADEPGIGALTLGGFVREVAQRYGPNEAAVISSADGARADPGIRSQVGSPDTQVVDKGLVVRDILAAPEGDGRDASAAIPTA